MTDEKKYRTEIPNIIDDLGLDPHERALYVHYKRACGGNDCEWVESVRITAQRTKMSVGRASEARKSLVDRGLIRLISKGNDGTAVRAVNIWDLNTLFYQQEYRPDIDGWSIEQLKEWCQGVHNMNTLEQEEAPNSEPEGVGVQNVNGSVHNMKAGVHNMNNKKEPTKKEPKELLPKGNSGQKPPIKNKDSPPVSVLAYRSVANRFPDKATWPAIAEAVGDNEPDLQFWKEVVTAWIARGYKKINIDGMLDWFKNRQIPKGKDGRKTSQQKNKQPTAERGPISPEEWDRMVKST